MDDRIYCVNRECPYKDCNRRLFVKTGSEAERMVSTANLGGICRRYVYWVANKAEELK